MTIYYFEIEETTKGWLRIEADTLEEAREDVEENGFNASDMVEAEEYKEVTILDGGEEED
jgi:hypothetical protein